jgi:uncharacterized protein YjbI with pentapeptide repeats
LTDAHLAGSYLAGATLGGANLSQASLSERGFPPVVWADTRTIGGQEFNLQADLSGANMANSNLQSANLAEASLASADLTRANLRYAILRNANLDRAQLQEADLRSADMQGASLDGTDLSSVQLTGANLSKANLVSTVISDTVFVSVNPIEFTPDTSYQDFISTIYAQDCQNGIFLLRTDEGLTASRFNLGPSLGRSYYNSRLWENARDYICVVNLNGATIASSFPKIDLSGVNFSGATFKAANLAEAILKRVIQLNGLEYTLAADFSDIVYDELTDWPRGFSLPPSAKLNEQP